MHELGDVTTPQLVLDLWLITYDLDFPLTKKQEQDFIKHQAIRSIIKYPPQRVHRCLIKHRKLDEILRCLNSWTEDPARRKPYQNGPRTPSDSRSLRSSEKHLINKPPVTSLEDARIATPNFDIENRPDYF